VSMEDVSFWSYNGQKIPLLEPTDGRILANGSKSSLRALSGAVQLFDGQSRPLFTARKVNSISYAEALSAGYGVDRHPYLRVVWKPDVDLDYQSAALA